MDYEIIDSPQPSTMRLTIVLTRAGERNVTLDTFSIYVPFSRALVELQGLANCKPAFVGYDKVEVKITDAETGTLLGAAMDKRVGGKTFKNFDKVFIEDQHIDYPHQWRATGWVKGELYTIVYEERKDKDGEYYHLVRLWKATKIERLNYEENT